MANNSESNIIDYKFKVTNNENGKFYFPFFDVDNYKRSIDYSKLGTIPAHSNKRFIIYTMYRIYPDSINYEQDYPTILKDYSQIKLNSKEENNYRNDTILINDLPSLKQRYPNYYEDHIKYSPEEIIFAITYYDSINNRIYSEEVTKHPDYVIYKSIGKE